MEPFAAGSPNLTCMNQAHALIEALSRGTKNFTTGDSQTEKIRVGLDRIPR